MSFDRMDNYSGAYPGSLPRRSQALPQGFEKPSEVGSGTSSFFGGRTASGGKAGSRDVLNQWIDKTAIWGAEDLSAVLVNDATSPQTKVGQKLSAAQKDLVTQAGIKPMSGEASASASKAAEAPKTYSEIMKLGTKNLSPNELNWSNYTQAVKQNTQGFRSAIQSGNARNFFKDVSLKGYVTGTLGEKNFKPIKDVLTHNPNTEWGTATIRTAAAGLMGYDVMKHTSDAYKLAKAKEDGTFKSRLNTLKATGSAFTKYTLRDGATWEAAGMGAAIGRAVIPIALGGVSMGGIAVGALVGIGAQKLLDRALKTGNRDPVQQQKKRNKEASNMAEQGSPFRVNAIQAPS